MTMEGFRSPSQSGGPKDTVSQQVVETTIDDQYVYYDVPKPRDAFSSFVDHTNEFITFLEACIESDGVKEDKSDLYTTLFEMYLQKASSDSGNDKQEWEAKAKKLVEKYHVGSPQYVA